MKSWLKGGLFFAFAACALAQTHMATPPKDMKAGEAFKNVTTSTLKELKVADFLGAMGVMTDALGYCCADCHPSVGTDKADWVTDTPRKVMARKMTEMVAAINKANFGGSATVTCFTCHRGKDQPAQTITFDQLYGPPTNDKPDILTTGQGVPTADQIFDKYIAALGGAQKLAGLKSYIATGVSEGYAGVGGEGAFQIIAKAPDARLQKIVFKDYQARGENTRGYDGKVGWVISPRGLLTNWEQTDSELDGSRFDALLSFPGQIKTILKSWKVSAPDTIGDKDVWVVQGRGEHGFLANLYFDQKSGLLLRVTRLGTSPIGRIPVQMDYGDYREVDGIKFPFAYTFSWLDGRDSFTLRDVKVNAPVDSKVFAKP